MARLFKEKVLKKVLEEKPIDTKAPDFDDKIKIIKKWYDAYKDGSLKPKTESQCEQSFNNDFFKKLIKQKLSPNRKEDKNIKEGWQELKTIYNKIQNIDNEIDNMVFDLYNLTKEERHIVINSIPDNY